MKIIITFLIMISLFSQTGCEALKYKKVSAKDYPPNPDERVKKNMEEGRGFRILDNKKRGGDFEFASSNPLWKATLDTLNFMPLVSANYSGGIVITDWYSDADTPNESIKITVRFLTNEIRSDALEVKVFVKECTQNLVNCKINQKNNNLVSELKLNILKKASRYETQRVEKYKKENPYIISTPDNKRNNKKKD